jgi:hypothetical protein
MPEMPMASKDHGNVTLIRGSNDFLIANRTAGLDRGSGTSFACSN